MPRMVLTEVVNDGNIQYLNPDDEDEPGTQLYVTQARIQPFGSSQLMQKVIFLKRFEQKKKYISYMGDVCT